MIYISRFDLFNKGKILYRATMKLDDTFEDVGNGFEAYYVNTAVKDDSLVGELNRHSGILKSGCFYVSCKRMDVSDNFISLCYNKFKAVMS